MSLLDELAKQLDDDIIENFADIYEMNGTLNGIAKKHDLDAPQVIAAIATCADVPCAQERLIARAPAKLVAGLELCLDTCKLRASAKVLVEALLDGARRERDAKPTKLAGKPLPDFARPVRLPPPVDGDGNPATHAELETLVRALATAESAPDLSFTAESMAALGRALALGWLSHCAEPKHAWGARAAGYFPDDATARDLGMLAAELGPRVGQFSKAVVLVDALAIMDTRAALAQLDMLATKVKTKSVKDRAKAAFDAAAKRSGVSKHDLADKLVADTVAGAPLPEVARRLEQRMVDATPIPLTELVENILQREALRTRARGVVFGVVVRSKLVTFAIGERGFVGIDGKPFEPPVHAELFVIHPFDLTTAQRDTWRALVGAQPFAQLDRAVHKFATVRAMVKHVRASVITGKTISQGKLFALEARGWQRGPVIGGGFDRMTRELGGITGNVDFAPGITLARGAAVHQRITGVTAKGQGNARALAELGCEIETLR